MAVKWAFFYWASGKIGLKGEYGTHPGKSLTGGSGVRVEKAKDAGKGFDAVLLDLTVSGGMGGVEAAAKLKEIDPGSRLIASSAYSGATVLAEFRNYGFEAVLPKPWTAAEVSQVLRRVIVADRDRMSG